MPLRLITTAWIVFLMQAAPPSNDRFPQLVDVAAGIGLTLENRAGAESKDYILETIGNGAAFFDYDRDDDLDLLITNGTSLEDLTPRGEGPMAALYENRDGRFVDVTEEAGFTRTGWGSGVCVADYDNDGHSDVYLTAYGANVLYHNEGDRTFQVAEDTHVEDARWGMSCAFADYDRDGDVDLYVSNYLTLDESVPRRGEFEGCRFLGMDVVCGPLGLAPERDVLYRNDGDGTFTDVTEEAGVGGEERYGFGVAFTDLDNDGWPDIYVANDSVPNFVFRNNGNGTFSEIGSLSGASLSASGRSQAGMGVGVGDYDGNGFLDIFVTNFAQDTNSLYQNRGDMIFYDATHPAGLGQVSFNHLGWGTGFADLDNDGFEDIFVANGHIYSEIDSLDVGQRFREPKEVYRNLGNGRFREVTEDAGADMVRGEVARGAAFGDYDNDGDIDVVVINLGGPPSLYRNEGGNRGGWIGLRLEGTSSNRDAIGARVEIEAGGRTQFAQVQSGGSHLSHNDLRLHFGLGEETRVEEIRIEWPSGLREEIPGTEGLETGRFITVREGEGVVR